MTAFDVFVATSAIVLLLAVVRGVMVAMSPDEPYEKPEWSKPGLDNNLPMDLPMKDFSATTSDNSSGGDDA